MWKPKLHDYPDLEGYLQFAFAYMHKLHGKRNRADLFCDILRYCKHSYPSNIRATFWQMVKLKLEQYAEYGLRAVTVLWIHDLGPPPTINPLGMYAGLKLCNRPVLKSMRRRRKACIQALMRALLPVEIRHIIITYAGL